MITLQLPNKSHQHDYESMIKEFLDNGEGIIPGGMESKKGETFDEFLTRCEDHRAGRNVKPNRVPVTLYFILNEKNKVIWGVSIRHYLNDDLKFSGGNIGYGITPSERGKWYGSMALKLALEKCKELGMKKVLMTCSKDNIWSVKVIQRNWGIRDSEYEEWTTKERYRITL